MKRCLLQGHSSRRSRAAAVVASLAVVLSGMTAASASGAVPATTVPTASNPAASNQAASASGTATTGMTMPAAAPNVPGRGNTAANLFQWTWNSVAAECTRSLGPNGYAYVQVSPPQEHIPGNAWWTSY